MCGHKHRLVAFYAFYRPILEFIKSELVLFGLYFGSTEVGRSLVATRCHILMCAVVILISFDFVVVCIVAKSVQVTCGICFLIECFQKSPTFLSKLIIFDFLITFFFEDSHVNVSWIFINLLLLFRLL